MEQGGWPFEVALHHRMQWPCVDPWCERCEAIGSEFQAVGVVVQYIRHAEQRLNVSGSRHETAALRVALRRELGLTEDQFNNLRKGERWLQPSDYARLLRHSILGLRLQAVLSGSVVLHKAVQDVRLSIRSPFTQLMQQAIVETVKARTMHDVHEQEERLGHVAETIRTLMSVAAELQRAVTEQGGDPGPESWEAERLRLDRGSLGATSLARMPLRQRVLRLVTAEGTATGAIRTTLHARGIECTATQIAQAISGLRRSGLIERTDVRGVWRRTNP